jgi:hypothetical protein
MVGEDRRVYAVDDPDISSGAYYDGSWADEDGWEPTAGPRVEDLGDVSDGEKGELAGGSEETGKARK